MQNIPCGPLLNLTSSGSKSLEYKFYDGKSYKMGFYKDDMIKMCPIYSKSKKESLQILYSKKNPYRYECYRNNIMLSKQIWEQKM